MANDQIKSNEELIMNMTAHITNDIKSNEDYKVTKYIKKINMLIKLNQYLMLIVKNNTESYIPKDDDTLAEEPDRPQPDDN